MGTPHYMSPEQVRGAKADARSDIFTVGCVLYETLTGSRPFDAESMHAVLYKIMQEDPRAVAEAVPGTPPALSDAVAHALAKNPDERFQDASQMLRAIRLVRQAGAKQTVPPAPSSARLDAGALGGRSHPATGAAPAGDVARGRSRLLIGAGLALVLALAWAAWAFVLRRSEPPLPPPAAISQLTQRAIDSQLELARRKLEAGEFADAVRQAEGALRLDPRNAAAKRILADANASLKQVDDAVAEVRAAGEDRERLAAAAIRLMRLDPGHPDAERAATAAGNRFRPSAEEARRLAEQAFRSAEQKGAAQLPVFAEGADLRRQGEQALAAGQPVLAARRFLEARRLFERAERARR